MKGKNILNRIFQSNWVFLEKNAPVALWQQADDWGAIIAKTGKHLGVYQKSILVHVKDFQASLYADKDEWETLGKTAANRIINERAFRKKIIQAIKEHADRLLEWNKNVSNWMARADISKNEAFRYYRKGSDLAADLYSWSLIPVFADFLEGGLSNNLVKILESKGLKIEAANKLFVELTTINKTTWVKKEEQDLDRLAQKILKNGPKMRKKVTQAEAVKDLPESIRLLLDRHKKKWEFFGYSFLGTPLSIKYFLGRLQDRLRLSKLRGAPAFYLPAKTKLSREEKELFSDIGELMWNKDYRKGALMQYYYTKDKLAKILADMSGLRYEDTLLIQDTELDDAVLRKRLPRDIKARETEYVIWIHDGKIPAEIITGSLVKKIWKKLQNMGKQKEHGEVKGQVAYPGMAKGVVRIVTSEKDNRKVQTGEILVAHMTFPDLLPAMKRAAAIVTDTGGITCHAAIVARELKKPCVIGTKIATKVLKDGDVVEVDAEKGVVRKIS